MIAPAVVRESIAPATIDNGVIERLIEAATETLGHELGRYLGPPAERIEMHNGGRGHVLLYDDPVDDEDVDFVVELRDGFGSAFEEVALADYEHDGRRLVHVDAWPTGIRALRVTYTAGYEPGEGPAELRDLVLQMVVARIRDQLGKREGMQSETIGDYSYTRGDVAAQDSWPSIARRWRRNRL